MVIIFSFLFLIPYIEIAKIRSLFTYNLDALNFIPSIIIIMLIIMTALSPLLFVRPLKNSSNNIKLYFARILWMRLAFDFLVLVRIIFSNQPINILSQYSWSSIPFYFAFFVTYIMHRLTLDISKVHINAIYLFTLYLVFNIFTNKLKYGYFFGSKGFGVRSRLLSPGGGPVILGYTIAIMLALLLFYKDKITNLRFVIVFSIMIIASFLTGSRGSMWPIILLLIVYLIDKRRLKFAVLAVLLVSFLYMSPIEFLNKNIPRFFELTDNSRISTLANALKIYSAEPFFCLLFGKGLGMFFPYQKWYLYETPGMNYFMEDGITLLVQPHNSYVYLLVETGILGVVLFFYPIYEDIRLFPKIKYIKNIKYAFITIILIALLNLADSVFIIAPGSAALWWLILLSLTVYLYDSKNFLR